MAVPSHYVFDRAALGSGEERGQAVVREAQQPRDGHALPADNQYANSSNLDQTIVPQPPAGHWTTVSDIATALLNRRYGSGNWNNDQLHDLVRFIVAENKLVDGEGRDCLNRPNDALIYPGQVLEIPEVISENDGRMNVRFRAASECPPLINNPNAPAVQEIVRRIMIEVETPQRVALPVYVSGGNLRDGQNADIQDAYNLPLFFGHLPDQPDPAARGLGGEGTGFQTVYGTSARIIGDVLLYSPYNFNLGSGTLTAGLIPVTYSNHSGDRERDARQGSNATQQDTPGTAWRFDFPWISRETRLDGTFLPGLGIDISGGRVIDDVNSPHNNNQVYYGALGTAAYEPGMTMSAREVESNFREHNQFLQSAPTDAMSLAGLNNYSLAFYVNQERIAPQLRAGLERMAQNPTDRAAYQNQINLLRFQQDLVGISNYDITSQREISALAEIDLATFTGRENSPEYLEFQQRFQRLNPAEQIEYQIAYTARLAARNNVTGLNIQGEALTGERYPIRAVPRAQMRDMMIRYYTELATERQDIFEDMVERETNGERPDYDNDNPASVAAAVTDFVDNHTWVREYPEAGFSLEHMDEYWRLPPEAFNEVERFGPVGGTYTEGMDRSQALTGAMNVLAGDPEITRILLAASDDPQIAQAWAHFDNSTVQRPAQYGMGGWDRGEEMRRLTARGYGEESMTGTFSREETQGIIRGLGTAETPGPVMNDLIDSALNNDILTLRQQDLRLMATAGTERGRGGVIQGGHAEHLLYTLARERDNTTLRAIEARIRASGAPDAEAQIASLRTGVAWARNNVMETMLGVEHDELATIIAANETVLDGPSARVEAATNNIIFLDGPDVDAAILSSIDTTTGTGTLERDGAVVRDVSEENVRTLFTHLGTATGGPGAQRFLEATIAQSARTGGDPETVHAVLASAIEHMTPEDRLLVARRILATPASLNQLNLLVQANTSIPEADRLQFAADITNARDTSAALDATSAQSFLQFIAAGTQRHPEALTPIMQGIAGDARASRAVMSGLANNATLADNIVQRLSDEERTEIVARGNIRVGASQTPITVWNALATETSTPEEYQIEARRVMTATGLREFREASNIADEQDRAVASVNAHMRSPITRENSLEALAASNPNQTALVIFNMLDRNPDMVEAFMKNLNDRGDDRIPGFFNTWGRWTDGHEQGELSRIMLNLLEAREEHNDADIANYTQQLNAYLSSTATNAARATAVSDLVSAAMTTTGGQSLLASEWSHTLASLESNTELQGNVAAWMVNSIVAYDATHAGLLSRSTTWAQQNNYSVPGGLFLPFYVWWCESTQGRAGESTGNVDPGKADGVAPPTDPGVPGSTPPGGVTVNGGTLPSTPLPPPIGTAPNGFSLPGSSSSSSGIVGPVPLLFFGSDGRDDNNQELPRLPQGVRASSTTIAPGTFVVPLPARTEPVQTTPTPDRD